MGPRWAPAEAREVPDADGHSGHVTPQTWDSHTAEPGQEREASFDYEEHGLL